MRLFPRGLFTPCAVLPIRQCGARRFCYSDMILDRKADRTMSNTYHFQVNLGGMLDVLSNHLYKSPDVFLRELLQNGVDAVTLRQKLSLIHI